MPPRARLPTDRAMALAASVATLCSLFLATECCGHTAVMPLRLAHASRSGGSLAGMVLRPACQPCGDAPEPVTLLDRADGMVAPYGLQP
jgi:hypothetical protein